VLFFLPQNAWWDFFFLIVAGEKKGRKDIKKKQAPTP
jgi:hypothetical protein